MIMYYVCGFVKLLEYPKILWLKTAFPPNAFSPLTQGAEHPAVPSMSHALGEGKKTAEACSCTTPLIPETSHKMLGAKIYNNQSIACSRS